MNQHLALTPPFSRRREREKGEECYIQANVRALQA
jgi:hypothetical protein